MPLASQSAGRPSLCGFPAGGGKSGLHADTAPDNVRRGRPQGQRHRKQTAGRKAKAPGPARVKGCGKSAPRRRQRRRHGKPRREQDRIGAMRGAFSASGPVRGPYRSGWSLEAPGDGRPRGMAVTCVGNHAPYRTRLKGRLALRNILSPGWIHSGDEGRACGGSLILAPTAGGLLSSGIILTGLPRVPSQGNQSGGFVRHGFAGRVGSNPPKRDRPR